MTSCEILDSASVCVYRVHLWLNLHSFPHSMKTVKLKKKEDRRILRGHPWVFSNELERADRRHSRRASWWMCWTTAGRFVARGYMQSPFADRGPHPDPEAGGDRRRHFFQRKISAARALRTMLGFGDSFRALLQRRRRPAGPDRGQVRRHARGPVLDRRHRPAARPHSCRAEGRICARRPSCSGTTRLRASSKGWPRKREWCRAVAGPGR